VAKKFKFVSFKVADVGSDAKYAVYRLSAYSSETVSGDVSYRNALFCMRVLHCNILRNS